MPAVLVARVGEPPPEAALSHEHRLWQDDESFLLPNPPGASREMAPVATPQHKQEIASSLYRSRGSVMATGARTRIDDGISEGLLFTHTVGARPPSRLLRGHRDRMIARGGTHVIV
jgi:hypothetical protein